MSVSVSGRGTRHPLVDVELQPVELLGAPDVRDRFSPRPLVEKLPEAPLRLAVHLLGEGGEDLLLSEAHGKGQEHRRVQKGGVGFSVEEGPITARQELSYRHALSDVRNTSWALSFSASTSSPMSPFITASSL